MNLDAILRRHSFKIVQRWTAWAVIGLLALICWMMVGVCILAFVNYFVLFFDPGRPESTPAWVPYAELASLTIIWPLILLLVTSGTRTLHRALSCWFAVIGLVSLVAGGWNVAGHQFDRPFERVISGLFILIAVGVGGWWRRPDFRT